MYVAVTESGYGQTTVYGVMMSLAHLCFLYILYTWFIYRLLEYLLTAYDTYLLNLEYTRLDFGPHH